MKLVFARRNRIGSWLIRFGTFSQWSHVGLLDGDAVYDVSIARGVTRRAFSEFAAEYPVHEIAAVPCNDDAARNWANRQLGKAYDYSAILGIALRTGWATEDKWFCSEFVEAALQAGGVVRFREDLSRITPRDVWMVTPRLEKYDAA